MPEAYSREEEDVPGPPPVVAEDGMPERIDEEALVVEGVAMAEQLEEEAPMYAPDALEDEGPQHKPATASSAAAPPSAAFRGSGWSSPMARLPA